MAGMRLVSLNYHERRGAPLEWSLSGLSFGPVNLLVGRNSTGKTRALNVIGNLARLVLLKGNATQSTGFHVVFDNDGVPMEYHLTAEDGNVTDERVIIDGVTKLERDSSKMKIWAEGIRNFLDFQPTPTEVAALARKDTLQHPFLIPLHNWAKSVRHYHFGDKLGKEHFPMFVEPKGRGRAGSSNAVDDADENKVAVIIKLGMKEYPGAFIQSLIADMNAVGFDLSEIDIDVPPHISIDPNIPVQGDVSAIGVKEKGIAGTIYQDAVSQGMFRTLSILAQVSYSQLAKRASCILIDDIGEGLDFERSSALIKVLRNKAKECNFQLIMSTNDKYVMNHVPLEEWSVLSRKGCHVTVKNHVNSPAEFGEFKYVGLSNFAFFEMDFANGEPEALYAPE